MVLVVCFVCEIFSCLVDLVMVVVVVFVEMVGGVVVVFD